MVATMTPSLPEALLVHAAKIAERGFAVLPGVLSQAQCRAWSAALDELVDATPGALNLMQEAGKPGARNVSHGRTAVVQHVFNKASMFEAVYQQPEVTALVRHFLGQAAQLSSCENCH